MIKTKAPSFKFYYLENNKKNESKRSIDIYLKDKVSPNECLLVLKHCEISFKTRPEMKSGTEIVIFRKFSINWCIEGM